MNIISVALFAALNVASAAAEMKTPETSKLFEVRVDPVSKVESYILKRGLVAWNQQ